MIKGVFRFLEDNGMNHACILCWDDMDCFNERIRVSVKFNQGGLLWREIGV